MTNKWKYFLGAAILTGGLLIKIGVPIVPLILGVGFAALMTARGAWRKAA